MSSIAQPVARSVSRSVLAGQRMNLGYLIRSMFSQGEQGFAYDINDLSTLFQNAAGTIPVTGAGQPAGLVLDKSKGLVLGSEMVTNGDFSAGASGWNLPATCVVSNGAVIATNMPAGVGPYQLTTAVLGSLYKVSFTISNYVSGSIYATLFNTDSGPLVSSNGTFTCFIRKQNTGLNAVGLAAFSNFTGTIDNISFKELAGNHAYQNTPSMRPILRYTPNRIDYDGIDDNLVTNLPAQLTGATVIRAVPNVGTQILTNQTIATPYNDSTDHCGLIVINRALTQTETAQITQIFNRLAGV